MKKCGFLMMIIIFVIGLQSSKPYEKRILSNDVESYVELERTVVPAGNDGAQICGSHYVLPNVEYNYTITYLYDPNVIDYNVSLQILDPNTTAVLTQTGPYTYTLSCNDLGGYYIRVEGKLNGNFYCFDSFSVVCVAVLPLQ